MYFKRLYCNAKLEIATSSGFGGSDFLAMTLGIYLDSGSETGMTILPYSFHVKNKTNTLEIL
jgi:hypothetical protein